MRLVRTRDGWVILSLNSDASFRAAVEVFGDPTLGEDPRFLPDGKHYTRGGRPGTFPSLKKLNEVGACAELLTCIVANIWDFESLSAAGTGSAVPGCSPATPRIRAARALARAPALALCTTRAAPSNN